MRFRRQRGGLVQPVRPLVVGLWLIALLVGCGQPASSSPAAAASSPAASVSAPLGTATAVRPSIDPLSGLPTVAAVSLPREARTVLATIAAGGPFAYAQDGVVFQNREGVLPRQRSGHYHEYTVPTPGSPDRGARRIVTGGAGEQYYTDDHYATFRRIWP